LSVGGMNATVHDPKPKMKCTNSAKSRMDAIMQLTINNVRLLSLTRFFP